MVSPAPDRSRSARAVTAVVAVALSLMFTLVVLPGAAHGAAPDTAGRSEEPAGSPGVDFPVLPKRCYDPYKPAPTGKCRIVNAGRDRPVAVLWGDSHAWQYLPAAVAEAKERDLNLVLFVAGGCPPTLRTAEGASAYPGCDNSNRAAFDYVTGLKERAREVSVVLGSFWSYYRRGYLALRQGQGDPEDRYHNHLFRLQHEGTKPLFKALAEARVPFDLLGQSATVPDDVADCPEGNLPYQCTLARRTALPLEDRTRAWLARLTKQVRGRHAYIATAKASCGAAKCRPQVDGIDVYYDSYHFGARFAATLGAFFERPFDRLAARASTS